MEIIAYAVFLTNLLVAQGFLELKQEGIQRNMEMCKKLAKDPYFETDLVIGKPWRIYYTWNMKIDTRCLDIVFKNATPAIIHRIWTDMYDYLEQQPYWESAALHVTTGAARHEMLLFPAQGAAGGFLAVPNVVRLGDISPMRNGVPLLMFQLKLVRHGKYLVMMDCHVGVISLSARSNHTPYRSEIAAAVTELDMGDGFPACTQEKNKEEQFFVK
ncbi:uncharacterized protein [Epargyreus clarus]|uniref:uncharacterized protein n=1 Tax=Epargyreus clarus TaxID=520877 RepID=UPI003C2DE9F4